MSKITYLDPTTVTAVRQTDLPRSGQTRSGYGCRLPSSWMLRIGKRWYRVRVICWSNSGTAYVVVRGEHRYIAGNPADLRVTS